MLLQGSFPLSRNSCAMPACTCPCSFVQRRSATDLGSSTTEETMRSILGALLIVTAASVALGSDGEVSRPEVGATREAVRVAAGAGVIGVRLQVLTPQGALLYDSDWRRGNLL